MKRLFDIVFSTMALILLGPIILLICVLILIKDGAPAFFRQQRIGKDGKPFMLVKFRTMRKDAERMGRISIGERDPRVTDIGYWLRQRKLDELPQLWNILKGEMSIIGPRPEVAEYVALYDDRQRAVLKVRPGLSDPASLAYFDESSILADAEDPHRAYIEEVMPAKLDMNLSYIDKAHLGTDLRIIAQTIARIFSSNPSNP